MKYKPHGGYSNLEIRSFTHILFLIFTNVPTIISKEVKFNKESCSSNFASTM